MKINNKLYNALKIISDFFILNIIWFVFSLPLVTLMPATVAMFAVIRDLILEREHHIYKTFWNYFKKNFKLSFGIGIGYIIIIASLYLYVNANLLESLIFPVNIIIYFVLVIFIIIIILISLYLIPLMVHFDLNLKDYLKNSLLISIYYLPTTLIILSIYLIFSKIITLYPPLIVILVSVCSYLILKLFIHKINDITEE